MEVREHVQRRIDGVDAEDVERPRVHEVRLDGVGVEAVLDAVGQHGERHGRRRVEVPGQLALVAVQRDVGGLDLEVDAGEGVEEDGQVDLLLLAELLRGEVGLVLRADLGGVPDVEAQQVQHRQDERLLRRLLAAAAEQRGAGDELVELLPIERVHTASGDRMRRGAGSDPGRNQGVTWDPLRPGAVARRQPSASRTTARR
ncbi:MAG: hypothetical protein R3F59_10880 [Myxococcota bacterium]